MTVWFLAVVFVMVLLAVPYVARIVGGPTVFDRVLAINGLGTKIPALVVMVGLVYARADMFVDIALALFLLNLVLTLLFARYVREKRGVQ